MFLLYDAKQIGYNSVVLARIAAVLLWIEQFSGGKRSLSYRNILSRLKAGVVEPQSNAARLALPAINAQGTARYFTRRELRARW